MNKQAKSLFGVVEDHIEKYQTLESLFVMNRASTFFFQAEGESMYPTIFDGDVLVVDRSVPLSSGAAVVISHNGQFLCRRYWEKGGKKILFCDNPKHQSIVLSGESSTQFFGVVVAISRKMSVRSPQDCGGASA